MVSAQARRSQVEFASHRGISVRRACALVGVARSTMGYEPKMPAKDGPVMTVMRDLSSQYPRYGYRRIHIFLARRGHEMSPIARIACGSSPGCNCRESGLGDA